VPRRRETAESEHVNSGTCDRGFDWQRIGATIQGMRLAVLLTMFALITTFSTGQTATGIQLIDVRFRGDTRLQAVDLKKCAADFKSRMYEGPEWLDNITERVRLRCLEESGYFKASVAPSTEQLPDKDETHQFAVTFDIDAGLQYRTGQIGFRNNRVLSAQELRSMFKLASGDIFNPAKVQQGLEQMRSAYVKRGYRNFTVIPETSIDDSRYVISLMFDCDEGKQFR
jgi:outer membrane translocation and assembly module TamA